MAINTQKLSSILHNFVTSTHDIQGAALVTPDGLPLASERIGMELSRGPIDRIYVEGDQGYGILSSCGEDAVFLVLASQSAKQGLLMLEIKRALAELKLALM
jgi:uncharacterized protein